MHEHQHNPQTAQFSLATLFVATFVVGAAISLRIGIGAYGFAFSVYLAGALLGVLAPEGKHRVLAVTMIMIACVAMLFHVNR